jgi:hypothetical protein
MKLKAIEFILVGFWICFSALAEEQQKLKIYLPRETQINSEQITLGQICVVRGDESLVKKSNDIVLCGIYDSGREVIISRAMISGRLSSNGIENSKIEFSGADEVKVKAQYRVITGSKIAEAAQNFLKKSFQQEQQYQFNLVKRPKDLTIPGNSGDIQLTCRVIEQQAKDKICVEVAVISQDKEVDARQVYFQKLLQVKNEQKDNQPLPKQANTEVLVKRNKPVAVVITRPGLLITSAGRALEDGRAGEYIKVQMQITDSSRTIVARVNNDGTVEPLL